MSYGYVELDKAFMKGQIKLLRINGGSAVQVLPPVGKRWLILTGMVDFVTGTATSLVVRNAGLESIEAYCWLISIAAGTASQGVNIFNTTADYKTTQWSPIIVTHDMCIQFDADATAKAWIEVIEW